MKVKRIGCLSLAVALTMVLILATGCTCASEAASIAFSDATGKGTMISDVLIPLSDTAGNAPYVKDVQKIAEHLNEKVDRLTETKDIYEISYAGTNGEGEHIIRMSFAFDDINDYYVKAMRLYNSQPRSVRNSVSGMPETYKEIAPSWVYTDNGDGTYNVTFSQSAYAFTVMNLWAYNYLLNNDIPDAWDNTGNGQAAQYSIFSDDAASTFVRSVGATVTVQIGETVQTVSLYNGESAQTVTVTGTLSGTPTALDLSLTDEDITVKAQEIDNLASEAEEEPKGIDPWMISTVAVGAVTVAAVIIVAVISRKKGGNNDENA